MPSKNDVIKAIYAGFNSRDVDAVLAFMQPGVDWPNGMEGGRVHGRENVREYWRRQWGTIDPHVDPVNIEDAADGTVVVHVHQVIRDLKGTVLRDQMVDHVYSFSGELIDRMEIR